MRHGPIYPSFKEGSLWSLDLFWLSVSRSLAWQAVVWTLTSSGSLVEYAIKDWSLRVRRVNQDYLMELKQLVTSRMTGKGYVLFGRIRLCLNKPGQEGSNAMFSLVEYAYVWIGSPQVIYWRVWHWVDQEGSNVMIRIRSGSPQVTIIVALRRIKRVVTLCSLWWIHLCLNRKPSDHIKFWPCADQEGTDTYARWVGSPQVIT